MREENVDATRLFTKASKSLAKYKADIAASGEQQALFTAAIRALNAAARNGIITILARKIHHVPLPAVSSLPRAA